MSGLVTISASFGASGELVGRAVADRLGLPFFDRAIPATVAQRLSVPMDVALGYDGRAPSALRRLAASFAHASAPFVPAASPIGIDDSDAFRAETERILHSIADTSGGVVVGRAGMVVLRDRPDAVRVRLDGPVEKRIAFVVRSENMTEPAARALQRDVDAAREAYVRAFYRARQSDPSLYHVILDPTALGAQVCIEAIVQIATDHLADWLKPTS